MNGTDQSVIEGSCLCGQIKYALTPPHKLFQYCHCSRCQKTSGSAHAANIFVRSEQFSWLAGQDQLKEFRLLEAKHYGTVFCSHCGSSMPWTTADGTTTIVPAGGLDQAVEFSPDQSIFWGSHADWYISPDQLPLHNELPPKKK